MSSIMTSSLEQCLWQYSWFFKGPLPIWLGSMQLLHSNIPLKGCVCYILLVCFLCLKERTCETRKNVFYFTLKALFVLEIIKF